MSKRANVGLLQRITLQLRISLLRQRAFPTRRHWVKAAL